MAQTFGIDIASDWKGEKQPCKLARKEGDRWYVDLEWSDLPALMAEVDDKIIINPEPWTAHGYHITIYDTWIE